MKRLTTITSILLAITASSQCVPPVCTLTVPVSGTLTNKAYNSSVCFDGVGTISNSCNFNNWGYLSFKNQLYVEQTINMVGREGKAYTDGTIGFKQLTMDGQDTVWMLSGILYVGRLETNNTDNNVIMTPGPGIGVTIEGRVCYPGEYFQQQGNPSNRVYISTCGLSVLSLQDKPRVTVATREEGYWFDNQTKTIHYPLDVTDIYIMDGAGYTSATGWHWIVTRQSTWLPIGEFTSGTWVFRFIRKRNPYSKILRVVIF